MSIYLDYNASSPIDDKVLDYMVNVYRSAYGNSDSRTHDHGDNARQIVEKARKQVAALLKCQTSEVFFTSGATESNNLAILGLRDYSAEIGKNQIITTSIEHKAIIEATEQLAKQGFRTDYVDPQKDGRICAKDVLARVTEKTLLVSVMHANNETGAIQPVLDIGKALSEKNILFHVDGTQSCGKLVEEIQNMQYDMLSLSAHKMYGPQGVGAIVLKRKKHKLPPVKAIMFGGPQEHRLRPGTVPVALVAGLGKACELVLCEHEKNIENCYKIKQELLKTLESSGLEFVINGDIKYSMPNTLNVCMKGISSEALMLASKQYCSLSNGSACTSSDYTPSHVLKAMGISDEDVLSSIRISWSGMQDKEKIISGFKKVLDIARNMV